MQQTVTCADVIAAIEGAAPRDLQESWDNCGVQVGNPAAPCTGVLLCVDVTPEIIREAAERGFNLVVGHHPLIFRGLKSITGASQVERAVIEALREGITVYSAHTSLDKACGGISAEMAARLGVTVDGVLGSEGRCGDSLTGLGAVGNLAAPMSEADFIASVKHAFGSHPYRCSAGTGQPIERVAVCGGSGGEFIPAAIAAGAQAIVTADVRYHDFVDHGKSILIVDIGHFESESCAKDIFFRVIREKFANFAVAFAKTENNPTKYI